MMSGGLEAEVIAILKDAPGELTADSVRRILWAARSLKASSLDVEGILTDLRIRQQVDMTGPYGGPRTYRARRSMA